MGKVAMTLHRPPLVRAESQQLKTVGHPDFNGPTQ